MIRFPQRGWLINKPFWVRLLFVLLLGTVVGGGWGLITRDWADAVGQEPAVVCDYERGSACTAAAGKWARERFVEEKMGRSSGFDPHDVFKRPTLAREIWVRKIAYRLAKRRAKQDSARVVITANDRADAYEYYRKMRAKSPCVGDDRYVAYTHSPDPCGLAFTSGPLTKEQVKTGGSAILCGASVVIAVYSARATAFLAGTNAAQVRVGILGSDRQLA